LGHARKGGPLTCGCPFGKHKDKEFAEIPVSYLAWVVEAGAGSEALRKAVTAHVRARVAAEADALVEEYAGHLRAALGIFGRYAAADPLADEWLDRAQGLVFTSRLKGRAK
jgi:hypothetical protein